MGRLVEVAPERLDGWLGRYAASHGEVSWSVDRGTSPASWSGLAEDGERLRLSSWAPAAGEAPTGVWAVTPTLLVLLVRRGGYAVGLVDPAGRLLASKVGTRYVQSRTAAGGWSQQRYARRRGHQAHALVEAVAGHARRILEEAPRTAPRPEGVLLGGDRSLAGEVLDLVAAGPRGGVSELPRRTLWDLPDPRREVLEKAVARARGVQVVIEGAGRSA